MDERTETDALHHAMNAEQGADDSGGAAAGYVGTTGTPGALTPQCRRTA